MNAPTLSFLGRYRLVKVLGQGAMGVVYEAEDARLGRTVAIKSVLRSHMMEETTAVEFSRRFEREAQAAARLSHPNIVTVYDFGEHEDVAYIVMEFVRGRDLGQLFAANEKFTLHDTVRIMGELLAALDVAHRQGVVHRDVKPANVLINGAGHVKLTDFGVARVTAAGQNRTMPGTLVGTPSYMSPEQILGMPVGSRADIFAAGVILYQFLTGQRPFIGGGPFAVQRKIVQDPAPPPSQINPAVPPAFDAIVERALAKQPEQRYESAAAFAADLEQALAGVPAPAAPTASAAPAPPLDIDLPDRTVPPPTVAPSAWASTVAPTHPPEPSAQTTVPPPLASTPRPRSGPVATAGTAAPAAAPAVPRTPNADRTAALGESAFRKPQTVAERRSSTDDPDATVILLRTTAPAAFAPPAPTALPPGALQPQPEPPVKLAPGPLPERAAAAPAARAAASLPVGTAPAPAPAAASATPGAPQATPVDRATAAPQRVPASAGGAAAASAARAAARTAGAAVPGTPAASRRPAPSPTLQATNRLRMPLLAGAGVALVALAVLLAVRRPWTGTDAPAGPTAVGVPSAAAPPVIAAPPQPAPVPVAPQPAPAPADRSTTTTPENAPLAQTPASPPPAAGSVTGPAAPDAAPVTVPSPAVRPAPTPAPAPRRTTPEAARPPAPARPAAQPNSVDARCNDLLHRMQLGEPLSTEQTNFFQTRCTR
jgi:serine/threonine-protein kinase